MDRRLRALMLVTIWRFRVVAGQEQAFEAAYNSGGDWAQLFRRAPGYLGTEMLRATSPREYLTIDRWESVAAFDAFKRDFAADYARVDEACSAMTEQEQPLGQFTSL
jgi:heme-degrading monooxygenase HmoA